MVKNPPANAANTGDLVLFLGGDHPLEEEWTNQFLQSSIVF